MKPLLLFCISFLTCAAFADSASYGGKHAITTERGSMRVVHVHDWSSPKVDDLFLDLRHHEAFLGAKNDFSFIEMRDATGRVLFRQPSSALTKLWISPDSRYIVGLSSVMLYNPYQIMVWRTDGTLIYKEHISASVAMLSLEDFAHFAEKFPVAAELLRDRSRKVGDITYVDYEILGVPNEIGDAAWRLLYQHRAPNPYSPDFSSSVTNWIDWFDEKNPQLRIEEDAGTLFVVLASPIGRLFKIAIKRPNQPLQTTPTAVTPAAGAPGAPAAGVPEL